MTSYKNTNIDYNQMTSTLNQMFQLNNLYAKETDNIIKGNIPVIPEIPTGIPTGKPTDQKYNFMQAINKSAKDDSITTIDVSNDDTYDLIIQQNTMYILGSFACASLLIASIFIGKQE